jgi:hypothetical protein
MSVPSTNQYQQVKREKSKPTAKKLGCFLYWQTNQVEHQPATTGSDQQASIKKKGGGLDTNPSINRLMPILFLNPKGKADTATSKAPFISTLHYIKIKNYDI